MGSDRSLRIDKQITSKHEYMKTNKQTNKLLSKEVRDERG